MTFLIDSLWVGITYASFRTFSGFLFVCLVLDIPNVENIHSGLLVHIYEIPTQQALVWGEGVGEYIYLRGELSSPYEPTYQYILKLISLSV